MKKFLFLLTSLSLFFHLSQAQQQTIGIFLNTEDSFDGYTMFSPNNGTTTYLINNCGEMVHSWTSTQFVALTSYLGENGYLYRHGRLPGMQGENSPYIEVLDWDGNIIWSFSSMPEYGRSHHDFEILPNGNIVMIVHDERTQADVIQNGGNIADDILISEKLIEIEPDFETGEANLVWEWSVWDHLIQDVDADKPNYGVIADAPGRVDVNYISPITNNDWLHFNGVDYNAQLDQLVLSVSFFNEIWIIDHSTTSAEAAGSTGGNLGKGGDIIYRWGNPQVYDHGTAADQKLFFQHHPNWIPSDYPDGDKIIIYNNRAGEPFGEPYSAVNIIETPVDGNGNYTYDTGVAYGPENIDWTYTATPPTNFFSHIVSGAEQLPNGNVLICEGTSGRLFEVTQNMNTVWEYVSPIENQTGVVPQFTPLQNTSVFRTIRYAPDYSAFEGKDLTPQGYIEPGSTMTCTLYPNTTSNENLLESNLELRIYPNPAQDELYIETSESDLGLEITNSVGQVIDRIKIEQLKVKYDVSNLGNGIYFISIKNHQDQILDYQRLVKY